MLLLSERKSAVLPMCTAENSIIMSLDYGVFGRKTLIENIMRE
jgi:hypothetical protein